MAALSRTVDLNLARAVPAWRAAKRAARMIGHAAHLRFQALFNAEDKFHGTTGDLGGAATAVGHCCWCFPGAS